MGFDLATNVKLSEGDTKFVIMKDKVQSKFIPSDPMGTPIIGSYQLLGITGNSCNHDNETLPPTTINKLVKWYQHF